MGWTSHFSLTRKDKLVMDVMHNTKAESVLNMELWLIGYAVSVIDSGIGEHRKVGSRRQAK